MAGATGSAAIVAHSCTPSLLTALAPLPPNVRPSTLHAVSSPSNTLRQDVGCAVSGFE